MSGFAYLASPYSHPHQQMREARFHAACGAASSLMQAGLAVFSPIAHSHSVERFMNNRQTHEFWMRQDMEFLRRADRVIVLTLDGWQKSRGVSEEIQAALKADIPVAFMGPHYIHDQFISPDEALRFWARVNISNLSECWTWNKKETRKFRPQFDYGDFYAGGTRHKAHRLSYRLANGHIADYLLACHKCDNPPCVNPTHLFAGTRADNNTDMVAKGRNRGAKGIENPRAKLTEEQVSEILSLSNQGMGPTEIADRYGITASHVSLITSRRTWKHLEPVK